jgi:hypothetical protein
MPNLDDLKKEADASATWRQHHLGPWDDTRHGSARDLAAGYDRQTSIAECRCGAYVQVDTNPPPNGIDIGGSAVAVNCTA